MKPVINKDNINSFYGYFLLKEKTQMIKTIKKDEFENDSRNKGKPRHTFFNRMSHTNFVKDVAIKIANLEKFKTLKINIDRLKYSALLHDVGHTPYGHAGEDAINSLFLSKDEVYFSKNNAGLFKHNLNSIRLIGDYFYIDENNDLILIDSIVKHASSFPKNYNHLKFKDKDMLKQNFVLDSTHLTKSHLLSDFVNKFTTFASKCPFRHSRKRKINDACNFCESSKSNLCYFSTTDSKEYARTMYLSYQYPLTIEGTIVYWADEIACLCQDFADLFYFVNLYINKEDKETMLLEGIKAKIDLLETGYENKEIFEILNRCIAKAQTNENYDFKNELAELKNDKSLVNVLINCLDINNITVDKPSLNFDLGHCDMLFKLPKNTSIVFKELKSTIYSEFHKYGYIKKVNEVATNRIRGLAGLFFKNLNLFIDEYREFYRYYKKTSFFYFTKSVYSILGLKNSKKKLTHFTQKFIDEFSTKKSNKVSLEEESLRATRCLGNHLNSGNIVQLIQLIEREILLFISTMGEDQIDKYYASSEEQFLELKSILNTDFPTCYDL